MDLQLSSPGVVDGQSKLPCTGCHKTIVGYRYKCANCSHDVSYCLDCFEWGRKNQNSAFAHDPLHIFLLIRNPLPATLWPALYQVPLVPRHVEDPRRGDDFDCLCDGCEKTIDETDGIFRFKCANCVNFDFCPECFKACYGFPSADSKAVTSAPKHPDTHVFYIVSRRLPPPTLRPNLLISNLYAGHALYFSPTAEAQAVKDGSDQAQKLEEKQPSPSADEQLAKQLAATATLSSEPTTPAPGRNPLALVHMSTPPEDFDTDSELDVRPAEWADMAEILQLEREAFGDEAWGKPHIRKRLTKKSLPAYMDVMRVRVGYCRLAGYVMYVHESDTDLVTGAQGDRMHVTALAVRREFRGRGIGEWLLRTVIDKVDAYNQEHVTAATRETERKSPSKSAAGKELLPLAPQQTGRGPLVMNGSLLLSTDPSLHTLCLPLFSRRLPGLSFPSAKTLLPRLSHHIIFSAPLKRYSET